MYAIDHLHFINLINGWVIRSALFWPPPIMLLSGPVFYTPIDNHTDNNDSSSHCTLVLVSVQRT